MNFSMSSFILCGRTNPPGRCVPPPRHRIIGCRPHTSSPGRNVLCFDSNAVSHSDFEIFGVQALSSGESVGLKAQETRTCQLKWFQPRCAETAKSRWPEARRRARKKFSPQTYLKCSLPQI